MLPIRNHWLLAVSYHHFCFWFIMWTGIIRGIPVDSLMGEVRGLYRVGGMFGSNNIVYGEVGYKGCPDLSGRMWGLEGNSFLKRLSWMSVYISTCF